MQAPWSVLVPKHLSFSKGTVSSGEGGVRCPYFVSKHHNSVDLNTETLRLHKIKGDQRYSTQIFVPMQPLCTSM